MVTRRGGEGHGGFGRCASRGNRGDWDRGAPWKPVALKGGARQSCFVALERVGTRSVVGGFGEKCLDRKGMTRL